MLALLFNPCSGRAVNIGHEVAVSSLLLTDDVYHSCISHVTNDSLLEKDTLQCVNNIYHCTVCSILPRHSHLTFDRYQHSAVGLSSHIGCIAGVETIITLLAVQDLEDEVLSLVLINDVPAALADVCSILPPDNVGFGVTRHKAAEFGMLAFSHCAGTGEHTFRQLGQRRCP